MVKSFDHLAKTMAMGNMRQHDSHMVSAFGRTIRLAFASIMVLFQCGCSLHGISSCTAFHLQRREVGSSLSPSEEWLEGRVNVDIENKNLLYALGLLLSERSCTSTSYPPDMSFYIRKYDPSVVPVFSIWDNKQIIEYYNGVRDDPGREKWEYELVDDMTTLSVSVDGETRYDLIKQMAMATMVHCRIDKQGGKEKILIGPLEIMDPCGRYQRRVYRLPEAPEWWDASAVPARLGSSALECAYDKATGILVLIGEPQYLAPYECLLRAAGAERIGAATGCPRDERHEGHSDAGTPVGDGEE